MSNVTRIDWIVKTGENSWSGTNGRVELEIYRDDQLLQRLNLEPGNTPRLDQGTKATYSWRFRSPDGMEVSISGTVIPYSVNFPDGLRGHLKVKLIAQSDDAWEKDWIDTAVYSGELRHIPGTIDSFVWVEDWEEFLFDRDVVLSTDTSEGYSSLTLNY